jgi:cysteinyl-tRNA synthetase
MNQLHLYNTLSRKKELFEPLEAGFVGMYVCGPTVYGDAHLGHAKSYVSFDLILRYLRYLGYNVRYVQNITDVGHLTDDADSGEDKLQKQSRLERKEPMEIAEKYTYTYFRDMDALNVLRPDISPRASGHIPEQIAMIEKLIEKGHAYESGGNVYFDVFSDPNYGKLSGRKIEEAAAGTRVETASDKRSASDFALWKRAEEQHIMQWPSPWGAGYPGWHIECSAMSTKYLGESFDIHGGGLENQFPHHECEIAQSECSHGKQFVKYWLHNNMVTLNGQKMGKSLGNAISLHQFFSGDHPLLSRAWNAGVIRFFLLQSHYRSTTDFSEGALEAAESGFKNLSSMMETILGATVGTSEAFDLDKLRTDLEQRMNDDFNSAQALAVLFEQLKPLRQSLNSGKSPANLEDIQTFLQKFVGDVLGLETQKSDASVGSSTNKIEQVMQLVLELRANARANKDWTSADLIRNKLNEAGIRVEDGSDGTKYHI